MPRLIQRIARRLASRSETAAPYPQVSLVSWAPQGAARNFGDHLSAIVAAEMLRRQGLTLDDETSAAARLLAIGSILHFARDGDVVWGSGVNGKIALDRLSARRLDIRAVRGPKTAAVLAERGFDVPAIYGDPALLVPTLFADRFRPEARQRYAVVPNLHDLPILAGHPAAISPLQGWNRCIHQICRAEFVIASSLPGIIVAEAFGIGARYLRVSDTEATFKYDDYAQGTGRERLEPARSIDEALAMGPHPPIAFAPDRLMAAFPYDLWRGAGEP
jgi:pyruvyltransferase